jgi:diacylglycerol kinase family enzyme
VRILIYHNQDAGHDHGLPPTLLGSLDRAGHEIEWRNIKGSPLEGSAPPYDLIVAAGGDGSVGRTARQLVGSHVPIAVLPLGTANNLASTLDAGKHDLAQRIEAWSMLPFDAGTVRWGDHDYWFFEGFGLGAFAETAARMTALAKSGAAEPSREAELARDLVALASQSREQPAFDAVVDLDGERVHGPFVLLEVLNIGLIGPNVGLAPDVDPSDGALDVVLIGEDGRWDLVRYLDALKDGGAPTPPFPSRKASDIRITVPSGGCAHVDGASIQLTAQSTVTLGIEHHAVRFLGGTPD